MLKNINDKSIKVEMSEHDVEFNVVLKELVDNIDKIEKLKQLPISLLLKSIQSLNEKFDSRDVYFDMFK